LKENKRVVHVLGPHLRSWRERADAGESDVFTSGAGFELMLEQGAFLRVLLVGAVRFHGDSQEGTRVISAGADNAGRMYDVQTGQATQIAKHDAPIRVVKYVDTPSGGIVVTGSWDKTIKV
jgi:WD40 repeat protein